VTLAVGVAGTGSALWFLSRGTGVVSLALLTLVMVLGVLTRGGVPLPGAPRFVTAGLHRNATLLALSLLVVHIATAVADPYAPIRLVDAIVPFTSAYRPLWLGLGALALDLMIAVAITSLLRLRIGVRAFRAVHWCAYAIWPVALVHALGTGTDARAPWLLMLGAGSVVVVATAILWRVGRLSTAAPGRRLAAGGATAVAPILLAAWTITGPLAPHWAARAGTPKALLHASPTAASTSTAPGSAAPVSGTVSGLLREKSNGGSATIVFSGPVRGSAAEQLQLVLHGTPEGSGIALTSGTISLTPAGSQTWSGAVTGLQGGAVLGQVSSAGGSMRVEVDVQPDASAGTFTGTVRVQ
jgi:methionine sulfoxide reductase heme-binding subunit